MSEFNKDFLADLGMDKDTVSNAEAESIHEGFQPVDSGAYKAEIKEIATFKSGTGATMMKVVTLLSKDKKEITEYHNTVKKDGSPNKIGQEVFTHLMDAVLGEDKSGASVKKEKITAYAKETEASVIKGLAGKPFIAMVMSVHEEGAKYDTYNIVQSFANASGQNIKGEDLVEKFKEKILEKPILERKAKAGAGGASAATAGTTTATAASIADQL